MKDVSPLRKFRIKIQLSSHNIYYYYDNRKSFSKDQDLLKTKYDNVVGYVLLDGSYNRI